MPGDIDKIKRLAALDSTKPIVWNNGVEEALTRIAEKITNWDARDISAFRYLAKIARSKESE